MFKWKSNINDDPPKDRWVMNHDIMYLGTVIGDFFKGAFVAGQKALGKFTGDMTDSRNTQWGKQEGPGPSASMVKHDSGATQWSKQSPHY